MNKNIHIFQQQSENSNSETTPLYTHLMFLNLIFKINFIFTNFYHILYMKVELYIHALVCNIYCNNSSKIYTHKTCDSRTTLNFEFFLYYMLLNFFFKFWMNKQNWFFIHGYTKLNNAICKCICTKNLLSFFYIWIKI